MANEITLKVTRNNGIVDTTTIPSTSYNVHSVEILPGSLNRGAAKLEVMGDGEGKAGLNMVVEFVERCVPEFPVYVRWINRKGGYEYYMFEGFKTFGQVTKRGDMYEVGGYSGMDSVETFGELPPEVENTIACGAQNLSIEDFELLGGIILSPRVEKFNQERQVFERVILKDTAKEWNTSSSRGIINLELTTIKEQIQF
jgi:hypothetical protein|nr:MAG TPA: hypothetical protein [Caudoviricetes sp.]